MTVPRLTLNQVRASFACMLNPPPAVLSLDQAARLIHLAPATLSRHVSQRTIRLSVRRSKPLVFFRDLLVMQYFGMDVRQRPRAILPKHPLLPPSSH